MEACGVLIRFGERQQLRFAERACVEGERTRCSFVRESVRNVDRRIASRIGHGEMALQRAAPLLGEIESAAPAATASTVGGSSAPAAPASPAAGVGGN